MATIIGKTIYRETLLGGNDNDILMGGLGENILRGGAGRDAFAAVARTTVNFGDSYDIVSDFKQGVDKIDVSTYGVSSFDQLKAILRPTAGSPNDAYFDATFFGQSHNWQIKGVRADKLTSADFIYSTETGKTIEGTGQRDVLFGTKGDDILNGLGGHDVLIGGYGNDILRSGGDLYGGAGKDIFTAVARTTTASATFDMVMDFKQGVDKIDVSAYGISSFDQLKVVLQPADYDANDAYFDAFFASKRHSWQIKGISVEQLTAADFIFSASGGKTLKGSDDNDTLFGSAGSDTLIGYGWNDYLLGGSGHDKLIGGTGENTLRGGAGRDAFTASIRTTEDTDMSRDTILDFNQGVDKIDVSAYGISSFDQMKAILQPPESSVKEDYFDAYFNSEIHSWHIKGIAVGQLTAADFIYDTTIGKTVEGTIENDRLFGTTGNDNLRGYAGGDDLLAGNGHDKLYGGAGENTLRGGAGRDIFMASARTQENFTTSRDIVVDFKQGTDKIDVSAYGISSFDQLKVILEVSKGGPDDTFFNAFFDGRSHSWQINGIAADKLTAGDFIYSTGTGKTVEGAGYSDCLFGTTGNDNLKGFGGNDYLLGGDGNDKLFGGLKTDLLDGGVGKDIFVFENSLGTSNIDIMNQFSVADDTIWLDDDIFQNVGNVGDLATSAFHIGASAQDSSDRIIYDKSTGKLLYDADGFGSGRAIHFGWLHEGLKLTAADFDIIA